MKTAEHHGERLEFKLVNEFKGIFKEEKWEMSNDQLEAIVLMYNPPPYPQSLTLTQSSGRMFHHLGFSLQWLWTSSSEDRILHLR